MTTDIRVAFVGGGLIAKAHAAAQRALPVYFPDVPRLRPLVVCDATGELARAAAARLGFEESAAGWAETVRRADVDAVVVATPPDLHHDVVLAALAAGKHVLCEKPLARTAAEARAMCEAAEAAGVVHLVGFNLRQAPALRQARRLIREGALGEIHHVTGRYFQDHGRDPSRPMNWRYQAARAGSGALGDVGSHLIDIMRALVGEIETVAAASRTVVPHRPATARQEASAATEVDVDDHTAFIARFTSGAIGTFEMSRVAAGRKNQLALEVNGSEGSLAFDWERSGELRYFAAGDAADRQGFRRIVVGPAQPSYPGLLPVAGLGVGFFEAILLQSAAFARAIAEGAPAEGATFHDGLRACEVVDAILESTRTGGWARVPANEPA